MGIGPLLQFPNPWRAGPVLRTLLFSPLVPSSYQALHDSIYSFPLVRHSCPLSAGVLHALLCLKVYSWCIRGERCTPRPPIPLPPCSLIVASWPACRFLRRQVRWSGIPISWRNFHSLLWSTESKALAQSMKQMFFLEFYCFFYDPMDVGNLISGSSTFSKSRLNIWKFSVQVLVKPSL